MKEKVYTLNSYWDSTILEGTASVNSEPYYFDGAGPEWDPHTGETTYRLTKLSDPVFKLILESWDFWQYWVHELWKQDFPHNVNYAKWRETQSFEEITYQKENLPVWEKFEANYQIQKTIDDFLIKTPPTLLADGNFSGSLNFQYGDGDFFVEWSNIQPIK